ncbi:MAG: MmgE/PrpD family protein [Lachnospiraceae bacterium]|nr:MmgE/PrpD family protein [Lachnospiraceae bacterium]
MAVGKVTEALIRFALETKYEDIPEEVVRTQKKSLLDSIGVMAAATTLEPACAPFIGYAVDNSREEACTIIGTGRGASPVLAAMANGALIHALDYEDGHDGSKTHPNTASIPALLALSQSMELGGRDMLAAMAVSGEIACRLKQSLRVNDLACGWYSPPMFSAYGAVLGGARALGLDQGRTRDALSICMTQILLPGQSACSGESVLRAVRDAFSAKATVFSLLMAQAGVTARLDEPFEGKLGLFRMMANGDYDLRVILDGLGEQWECARLRYKAWPCCGTVHGALDAVLELVNQYELRPDEVQEIHLEVNPNHLRVLEPYEVKYRPKSLAAAKFSMPFSLALAVWNRDLRLDMYREEALKDERLLQMAQKVTYCLRAGAVIGDDGGDDHITVVLKTGRGSFRKEQFVSLGAPEKPLSEARLAKKFLDCMQFSRYRYNPEKIQKLPGEIKGLEQLPSVGAFVHRYFSAGEESGR